MSGPGPALFLDSLLRDGYTLRETAGRLGVSPAGRLSPGQAATIRANYAALLELVRQRPAAASGAPVPPAAEAPAKTGPPTPQTAALPPKPVEKAPAEPKPTFAPWKAPPSRYASTSLQQPAEVAALIERSRVIALDLETTGLNPRKDRVRLLSVGDGKDVAVLDCSAHDPKPLLQLLHGKILIAHHAAFDLGFLWHLGLNGQGGGYPETVCTFLLAQLVTAGEGNHGFPPLNLGACCGRWLERSLDKELQKSDFSGPLTPEQIAYARADVEVLPPLFQALQRELEKGGLYPVSEIELRALPAFVWLAQSGVPLDTDAWRALAGQAKARVKDLEKRLDAQAPGKPGQLFSGSWNWASPQQVTEVLRGLGFNVDASHDAQLAAVPHPIAKLIREHREASQLVKMYGSSWLAGAEVEGERVYPGWKQIGSAAGRTSCERPNMQQVPRDHRYRSCVKAPAGRVLVKADYSLLQMRIAAKRACDPALLRVFRSGEDVHSATAKALLGKQEVSKADRQIAKSANFALLFGASAEGLRNYSRATWGVEMTAEEAEKHRAAWFVAYPGLARWRADTKRRHAAETRSANGRRRLLPVQAPDTWRLNSPVQADEADGLKLALALLWERRGECPGAFPVLAVHDEICVECPEGAAEEVKGWLTRAMVDGMAEILDPVPCVVEAKIGKSWGG